MNIPLALYNTFFSWHLDPPVVIGLLISECIYILMVQRLWRKAGQYDVRAAWYWSLGLLTIFVALESPLDTIAEQHLLSAHMLQHELLLSVAPPLLLLGLFPRLVVPITRPVFKPLLRNRSTRIVLQILFSPYCSLALWLVLLYIWHLPSLYMLALNSPPVHIAEHLIFITAGMLFWLPIIEPVPGLVKMQPLAKLVYLAIGQVGTVPLVATLLWSPGLLYPYYGFRPPLWGIAHSFDQQLAGILMMTIDMLVALTATSWIVVKAVVFAEWQNERYRSLRVIEPL